MDEIDIDRAIERDQAVVARSVLNITKLVSSGYERETPTHCVDCDDPIPEQRRRAVPWSDRCVSCQETHEK